ILSKKRFYIVLWIVLSFSSISTFSLHAQRGPSANSASPQTPVFRSSSRLVVVDVIATNDKGEIVSGLKAGDFNLLEDGKPQKIWNFSSHADAIHTEQPATPIQLPSHQFTNITTTQRFDRAITVVLLDRLNSAGPDQAYARQQMIEFLKRLPEGERIALFTL